MSTAVPTHEHEHGAHEHGATPDEPGAHAHPSDLQYIVIGLILAGLTAIEVGLYYLKGGAITNAALLLFMALKFLIVVGFFMHLRFDSPIFRRLFAMGLCMAIAVYTVVLLMFGFLNFK